MNAGRPDEVEYDRRRREHRAGALDQIRRMLTRSLGTFQGRVLSWSAILLVAVASLIALDVLDPGSAADWMAAGGAIFAAVVALNIATKDRRERISERSAADLAQMRLVQLKIASYSDSDTPSYNFRVTVTNHGRQPILDARIESASLFRGEGALSEEPPYQLADPGPRPDVIEVIPHVEQQLLLRGDTHSSCQFIITLADANGVPFWPRARERAPYIEVRLACTDADGNHWTISNRHGPQLHMSQPNPPVIQRIWTHRRETVQQLWLYFGPSRATVRALRLAVIAVATSLIIALALRWLGVVDKVLACWR